MGVVSGVVLSYEFGTNWSELSRRGGNVIGPLMSYEVLTAFFLEAGFLGIMLFGHERVPKAVHFFATAMVALGTVDLGILDPVGQQLDADASRLHRGAPTVCCMSPIGGRSSSTRPSPIASPIWSPPPISPPPSSWPASAPGTSCASGTLPHGRIMLGMALEPARLARAAPDRYRRSAWAEHA